MRQTHGNITCFFDESDVDPNEPQELTGDEAEIAETEAKSKVTRQAKLKQIYLEFGVVR
jgi:hypothetical protein